MSDATVRRFPLSWPANWRRTPAFERQRADFGKTKVESYVERRFGQPDETKTRKRKAQLTASDAALRLEQELERLGAEDAKLSTSQKLRIDGTPRSDLAEPTDVGAAVYFTFKGKPRVLACDKWTRVADNIAAIAQHIDALRRIERYGIGDLNQAFAGYTALPARASPWWTVLEFEGRPTSFERVEARFSELARTHHPDRGGSSETMAKINAARDAARLDLTAGK